MLRQKLAQMLERAAHALDERTARAEAERERDTARARARKRLMANESFRLEQEVADRSTKQALVTALNVPAIGTIVGFTIGSHDNIVLLLSLAPLSSVMGWYWLSHAIAISRINRYLAEHMADSHEADGLRAPVVQTFQGATLVTPFIAVFLGPAFGSALAAFHVVKGALEWSIWGIGLAIATGCLVEWVSVLLSKSFRHPGISNSEVDVLRSEMMDGVPIEFTATTARWVRWSSRDKHN